jgi:SAM-dependent methyltransferase
MDPAMKEFYDRFYAALVRSQAHAEFCERVFGRNLCQHGFATMAQVDKLIEVTQLLPGQCALDLGCGNGMIAEYVSDNTGAHVTGLDYIDEAIRQAQELTASKSDRLSFQVGDITALDLGSGVFDLIISIDSIYFSQDYSRTIRELATALKPGGQMAFYYSQGREPWVPVEEFDKESILPDHTPLAVALQANHLPYETWDFTEDDYRIAKLRYEVLTELKPRFEAEDNLFIYENRIGDAQGIRQAIEEGLHKRYLYRVQTV